MRNRKVLKPPLLEKNNFYWQLNFIYKMRKSKRLTINKRQYNVTVSDKDPSSDKTKTIPSTTTKEKKKKN